ncbi:hypothetical protein KFE94_11420 [bacterium SCSIO 12643]|nr:hypothetical protein KFE94_11420 [bacterium SCSIO 12643]
MNFKLIFHYISYLQYPVLFAAVYYMTQPYIIGLDNLTNAPEFLLSSINKMLVFLGIGISFSTLQDSNKTSMAFEKKIWENPQWGKISILIIAMMSLFALSVGLFGYFAAPNEKLEELSFGLIVLGIGFISLLKTAVEVYENHQVTGEKQ